MLGISTSELAARKVKIACLPDLSRVLGGAVCDERYSQLRNGWLRKVGVPGFPRLRLLALFARQDHFLLLDEPDNHLDAAGIDWLGRQLAHHRGGYLLVSHDRRLLNQASQILELGELGLQSARLSFEAFLAQQAEEQVARSARLAQAVRGEKAAARSVQKVREQAARRRFSR